jgi:hypothetical protein
MLPVKKMKAECLVLRFGTRYEFGTSSTSESLGVIADPEAAGRRGRRHGPTRCHSSIFINEQQAAGHPVGLYMSRCKARCVPLAGLATTLYDTYPYDCKVSHAADLETSICTHSRFCHGFL